MKAQDRAKRRTMRAAARAPNWLRHAAATKASTKRKHIHGTFGPASAVRRIDPASYDPQAGKGPR